MTKIKDPETPNGGIRTIKTPSTGIRSGKTPNGKTSVIGIHSIGTRIGEIPSGGTLTTMNLSIKMLCGRIPSGEINIIMILSIKTQNISMERGDSPKGSRARGQSRKLRVESLQFREINQFVSMLKKSYQRFRKLQSKLNRNRGRNL